VKNLAIQILRHAKTTPDHIATQSGMVNLTYAQLEERARKAAYVLRKNGVGEGSIVGIALRDGQQTITAMLGVWLLGGTCSLIDFRTPESGKKSMSSTSNFVLLLEDRNRPDAGYPGLSLSDWAEEVAAAPMAKDLPATNDSPAYLSLTSGTTGAPAEIEISHEASLCRAASWAGTDIGKFYKRYLSTAPMSFGASQGFVINSLMFGGTVVFFPNIYQPRDLVEAFEKHRITGCTMVPTVLRDLLRYVRETGETLATPDTAPCLLAAGAAIQPAELIGIRDLLSPNVFQQYACLPVGPVTFLDVGKEGDKVDTVGRPLAGVEVEIIDQDGIPLPSMTIGQIRIRTPGRATSIAGRAKEIGGDYFIGDWYYPCDLGLIDEDGYLKLMGRSTDVIIRGGVNVYPQEVEAVAAGLPGVRQVAAIGYPDERAGEEIALFAVVDAGVDVEQLHRHCNAQLTSDKRPKRILVIPEMPLNANGKIARQRLAMLLEND
jgi:acyl-CoA synthetase (AMP-forming)/AMP-acid ligase II